MKATSTRKKSPAKAEVKENSFPVVAIGASAGGLEAMMELLKYLPADTGMAFIYVQHLSPDHKSMLTEILSKKTKMIVQEIDDMDKIKPDNVFVIPYNKGIEVNDGHIKLIPRSESSAAISIDILFSSLAEAQKERVIGIILSGSASDGTMGMKTIKQEGGLTFAQDDTAKFTSMPHSAIAAGMVDYILSPKEIALELARLSKHPFIKTIGVKSGEEELIENNNPDLKIILNLLHKSAGVDFSAYKMNTIKRRIIRRMMLYKITLLKEYAKLLSQNKEEIDILYQDLLINITSFFRDTDTHKYLKENLLPKLLKRKQTGESLRIWIPACATGEEAYSIAMMLLEIQEGKTSTVPVQIFATDLSVQAINKARAGIYKLQELETVSPKRIQRFFCKTDSGFRVSKAVRDMCVFAPHNILRDPPFSRLDFISCCNLFIYLDNPAQKKAVTTFHYALHDDGFLMLGKSENISHSANLFTAVSKKYKIFSRKKNIGARTLPALMTRYAQQTISQTNILTANTTKTKQSTSVNHNGLDSVIDAVLISEFMPAGVVINHQMEIVQFRGTTDLFLTHPKGKATFNVLKMARPEIAFELRNAISKVIRTKHRVRKSGIELKIQSSTKIISLEIVPLAIESYEPLILILFSEQEQAEHFWQHTEGEKNSSIAKDHRIKKLEEELASARADALAIAQEHEAFAEELQSANEEIVSSNEELQTVNEELETSKEEIESANEELTTTNQELQTRNDLLNEAYDYSEAVFATIHEPMIVLDKNLRIKSANKTFYETFNVKEEDTEGVLLYDLGNKQWNIPRVRELLEDILPRNSHLHNFEITHTFPFIGEKTMLLNARRIIQKMNHEELILVAFSDVTERIQAEKNRALLSTIVESSYDAIISKTLDGIITSWNKGAEKIFGYESEEAIGKNISMLIPPELAHEESMVIGKIKKGETVLHYDTVRLAKGGVRINISITVSPIKDKGGKIIGASKIARDITDQIFSRKKIEQSEQRFRNLVEQTIYPIIIFKGEDLILELANEPLFKIWKVGKEALGKPFLEILPEMKGQPFLDLLLDVLHNSITHYGKEQPAHFIRANGEKETVYFNYVYQPYKEDDGIVSGVIVFASDVTEQVLARQKAEESKQELMEAKISAENALKFKQQFLSNMSHEIRTPMNAIIGFTKVALKTELTAEQKEYLLAIKISGDSLIVLINDILDLAKVDAGKMTFEKLPFEIHKSIRHILHSFNLKIKEKNLELVKEYDSKIPAMLMGDSVRLNQIILNLISNAVKFTHKGKIILSVKLLSEDDENVTIEFAVTDSGIGIAADKINSIFNLFEQAEIGTANSYGGTGLGLAIVKQLVESQGGSISVRSRVGKGSTFSFILTFGKTTTKSEEDNEILQLDSEIKAVRVLVVEDVALNQLLIKSILNDFGFEYEIASNGKIALEKLQTNEFDIILMDLQMSVMNGFEATEYIRKTMKSQIPIIALTADVSITDIAKWKEFGMDDYISKPINENLLYNKIVALVKRNNND